MSLAQRGGRVGKALNARSPIPLLKPRLLGA